MTPALLACVLGASIAQDGAGLTRQNEGCRLRAYTDTLGHWTIGYGHLLREGDERTMSQEQANELFRAEYRGAAEQCWEVLKRNGVETERLPVWVAIVCIDMTFNLGAKGFASFHAMLAAIAARDYFRAARELLASRYAGQVPLRARKLASILTAAAQHALEAS